MMEMGKSYGYHVPDEIITWIKSVADNSNLK
jgi:hypothetical protein